MSRYSPGRNWRPEFLTIHSMKIEEYYRENYPAGKPWAELSRRERKEVKKSRRRERMEDIRETLEDMTDYLDLALVIFGSLRGK